MKLSLWRARAKSDTPIAPLYILSLSCVFITASGIKCKAPLPFPRSKWPPANPFPGNRPIVRFAFKIKALEWGASSSGGSGKSS